MNLEEFPDEVKKDIEDLSLELLKEINEHVIVIGGWAVRALIGDEQKRYTLDIDGVTSVDDIGKSGRNKTLNAIKYTDRVAFRAVPSRFYAANNARNESRQSASQAIPYF